jgi:RimJ/RimL family protein N-acetyltransferase
MSRPEKWANREELSFAITDAATGRFLGGCGLNQFHAVHRMANLGYWIRTSAAGRGAASAATVLVARYGLRVVGLQRIEILADVGNLASQRVAEKAGARLEGRLRNRLFHHSQVRDGVLYSLISDDLA